MKQPLVKELVHIASGCLDLLKKLNNKNRYPRLSELAKGDADGEAQH